MKYPWSRVGGAMLVAISLLGGADALHAAGTPGRWLTAMLAVALLVSAVMSDADRRAGRIPQNREQLVAAAAMRFVVSGIMLALLWALVRLRADHRDAWLIGVGSFAATVLTRAQYAERAPDTLIGGAGLACWLPPTAWEPHNREGAP